jgi:hypothetical protein
MSARPRVFDDDVLDGVAAHVIVAAQVGARPQKASEGAIVKCR